MNQDRTHLFDIRVVERNIVRGTVKKEEYEQYLAGIEDSASYAENTHTVLIHTRAANRGLDRGTGHDDDEGG